MLNISQNQALKRWGTLPEILRESILSSYNAEILWRTCQNQHLSDDKIDKVAILAGDVLMGFIHPEDFALEIKEALNINIGIADTIATEINRKIFFPLKNELEKIYQPTVPEFTGFEEEGEKGGAPVLDLKKKMADFQFKAVEDEFPKQENKIDLSKTEPVIAEKIVPVAEKIEEPVHGELVLGEKEEKKVEEPAPAISTEPLKEEGPLIIHQETEFKPLSGKLKSLGGMFNFLRDKDEFKKEEAPVKAELEIGEEIKITEEPKIIEEAKPEPVVKEAIIKKEPLKEIKVVNYGEEIEPAKETILDLSKKAESMPENLPVAEEIAEIKPEIKISKESENIEPKIEPKKESEEMIDLEMFK